MFAASITLVNTQLMHQFVSRHADAVNLQSAPKRVETPPPPSMLFQCGIVPTDFSNIEKVEGVNYSLQIAQVFQQFWRGL